MYGIYSIVAVVYVDFFGDIVAVDCLEPMT